MTVMRVQRTYNGGRMVCSTNGVGKSACPHAEIGPLSATTRKSQLKIEERIKCQTSHYKIPRRKQGRNFMALALAMIS